jgi:subtilisin family serine protease
MQRNKEQKMKKQGLLKMLGIIWIVTVLFVSSFGTLPVMADTNPDESASTGITKDNNDLAISKISSSLSLHIKMKTRSSGISEDTDSRQEDLADINSDGAEIEVSSCEKVFLYFNQFPTDYQIDELNSLGVIVYPDTWIPPVGNHPAGFILADMPLDKLNSLAEKNYLVKMDTAEKESNPQNDLARAAMGVDSVWAGGDTGAGVTVAVLDSGIDTSNPDFPALNSANSKDYSHYDGTPGSLDDTITNSITGHGTHVAGSVLGRGVNSSTYKGVAPGANLVFLKIGNDDNSSANSNAIVGAIKAAVDVYKADIITMSYGGWSDYHDGSDAECQAVDYAVNKGTTVFMSAGNSGDKGWHYSGTIAANSTSTKIPIVVSKGNYNEYYSYLATGLVWYDGLGTNNHLRLHFFSSASVILNPETSDQSESSRGTECIEYQMPENSALPSGTYYLQVQNLSSISQSFHIYYYGRSSYVAFSKPNSNYTIGSPAEADGAIAVGAYTTRASWTDYQNNNWKYTNEKQGSIGTFSSQGPRVDTGAPQKPEIVAPGVGIISVRDKNVYPWPNYNINADAYPYYPYIIDNNGSNLNGSGPADYFVMSGTSMACPIAAGVGALILNKHPEYTPAQVKSALEFSATDKGGKGFDNVYGWGLINASRVVNLSDIHITTETLPDGDAKSVYPEQKLLTSDGVGACTWSITKGKLPAGLTIKVDKTNSSIGIISGKPTKQGTVTFTVQVTDSTWAVDEQEFTININPALSLKTPTLSQGEKGVVFPTWTPTVSGGNSNYIWTITKGELPGLDLNASTGEISGTPTVAGSIKVTLTVADTLGGSASKALTFKIFQPVSITTTVLPDGEIGIPYKKTTLKASGGSGKYTWTAVSGLPNGLTLSEKGVLSGTPVEDPSSLGGSSGGAGGGGGGSSFIVHAEDTLQGTDNQSIPLTIFDPPVISDLPDGVVDEPYLQVLAATGGSGVYKFTIAKKDLPSWLKFDSKTFTLSGTPSIADNYTISNIKVTDSLKGTATKTKTLEVKAPDSTPPEVEFVTPFDDDSNVPLNAIVSAVFSEDMDTSTLNINNFALKQSNTSVSGVVTYQPDAVIFTPSGNLTPNTLYSATITTGVTDVSGNPLTTEYSWSFTTGGVGNITEVSIIAPAMVAPGDEFTVEIHMNNVKDLAACQFQINYDNNVVDLVDSTQYPGGIEEGEVGPVIVYPFSIPVEPSGIKLWCTTSSSANGSGCLAKLHFTAKNAGQSGFIFTNVEVPYPGLSFYNKLFDSLGMVIPSDWKDGEVTVSAP